MRAVINSCVAHISLSLSHTLSLTHSLLYCIMSIIMHAYDLVNLCRARTFRVYGKIWHYQRWWWWCSSVWNFFWCVSKRVKNRVSHHQPIKYHILYVSRMIWFMWSIVVLSTRNFLAYIFDSRMVFFGFCLAQLYYFVGTTIFGRIMNNLLCQFLYIRLDLLIKFD